jgi:hypothetical protein
MKKFIFAAALIMLATACDPTPKKCTDLSELQEAVLKGSTDTLRYDLNGDGEINIADINYLLSQSEAKGDSVSVDSVANTDSVK